jgi:hypothetical protein
MPLPSLPLANPETTTYRTGSGFKDFKVLLRELHEGVLELGVGQCEVVSKDNPFKREIGFELSQMKDGVQRWWDFTIGLTSFKNTPEPLRSKLATTQGRAEVARWMETGNAPGSLYGS